MRDDMVEKNLDEAGLGEAGFDAAIFAGTGLSRVLPEIGEVSELAGPLPDLPEVLESANLLSVTAGERKILAVTCRPHFHEGHSLQSLGAQVAFIKALGIRDLLILTTACGLDPSTAPGTLLIVDDHINMFPGNPLIRAESWQDEEIFPKFIPLRDLYALDRILLLEGLCIEARIPFARGVYIGVPGPVTETRAEYRMFRSLGGDAIGMTLVPEAIAAGALGIRLAALALVTARPPEGREPIDSMAIMEIENEAAPVIGKICSEYLKRP